MFTQKKQNTLVSISFKYSQSSSLAVVVVTCYPASISYWPWASETFFVGPNQTISRTKSIATLSSLTSTTLVWSFYFFSSKPPFVSWKLILLWHMKWPVWIKTQDQSVAEVESSDPCSLKQTIFWPILIAQHSLTKQSVLQWSPVNTHNRFSMHTLSLLHNEHACLVSVPGNYCSASEPSTCCYRSTLFVSRRSNKARQ